MFQHIGDHTNTTVDITAQIAVNKWIATAGIIITSCKVFLHAFFLLTDLVAKVVDASTGVWGEAVDGIRVWNCLWDRQGAVLAPDYCASVSQLEEHLHR